MTEPRRTAAEFAAKHLRTALAEIEQGIAVIQQVPLVLAEVKSYTKPATEAITQARTALAALRVAIARTETVRGPSSMS